jgi:hypothetical protein
MTQKDIRALIRFSPFKPVRLHLVAGKDLRIPHPDFARVTAGYAVVANEWPGGVPGEVNLGPCENIARVEMLPRQRPVGQARSGFTCTNSIFSAMRDK